MCDVRIAFSSAEVTKSETRMILAPGVKTEMPKYKNIELFGQSLTSVQTKK